VPLSHAVLGPAGPRPPLVLLHGLFGSRGNLQTAANALARRSGSQVRPGPGTGGDGEAAAVPRGSGPWPPVVPVPVPGVTGRCPAGADAGCPQPRRQPPQPGDDVRSHEPGRAAAPGPPGHRQVHRAGTQHGRQDGHGAGLAAGRRAPEPDLVERLISVDISPVSTTLVSEFSAYISAMKSVNIPAGLSRSAARQLADSQLSPAVQHPQLRQFLLTNLVEVEGRYVWRVNLEAISHHLEDIMSFPVFHKPYPGPTLFLGGSNSPYISSKDYPEIQRLFPRADIQFIEGAGHIVHQDKFEEFITAVLNFLPPP
uniref:Abhydrolase domain containing 11 n=1 Tax=Anas platyrhynchos platyrhynchos TaxID=8840 RepID=U3J2B0_ANAPP